jgi:hypothetical protein
MAGGKVISRGLEVQREIFTLRWNKTGRSSSGRVGEQTLGFALVCVTVGPTTNNAVVARFAAVGGCDAGRSQAQFQKLSHGRGARGHPVNEPEVIDHRKFFWRKHDLEPFLSELFHDETRCSK